MTAREEIRRFVEETFYVEDGASLGDDDSLFERGIVDSTGVLDVLLFLEETFDLDVPDEDITPENFDSIGAIARYVARKGGATGEGTG